MRSAVTTLAIVLIAAPLAHAQQIPQRQFQPEEGGSNRWLILSGLAMAGAGAAMLMLEPKQPTQPTQPGLVSDDMLADAAVELLPDYSWQMRDLRNEAGFPTWQCEWSWLFPCHETTTETLDGAFMTGSVVGLAAGVAAGDANGWQLYQGTFMPYRPFKKQSPGIKGGGAALVVGGAVLSAVGGWSGVRMALAHGGATVSKVVRW